MIPLILTSVAATTDMGIWVWVLGEHRAIPRNFQHVVIDDRALVYGVPGQGYEQVLSAAVDQAQDHHAFVTEYAGSSATWRGQLGAAVSAIDRIRLLGLLDRDQFLAELRMRVEWSRVAPVLETFFPPPNPLPPGWSREQYTEGLDRYLADQPKPENFDPTPIVDAIWDRVVTPHLEANQLFEDHNFLTRLYTVLSPEEMTADPVFAFNPDLPEVNNVRSVSIVDQCEGTSITHLGDGRTVQGQGSMQKAHVEILREEGPPELVQMGVVVDEAQSGEPTEGCTDGPGRPRGLWPLGIVFLLSWLRWRRRR